jgi:hypothetical protein
MTAARHVSAIAVAIGLLSSSLAAADSISKEQCIDAHSRGQDAQAQGKITLARKLFLTCAQSSCPVLVQGDCARFVDDLSRMQSSLTFVARDAQGTDLPDTAVYIDDNLVLTRLDDGKPYEVDPGRHTIRFTSGGKDYTVTVVVGTGEKGRTVIATFTAINPPPASVEARPSVAARAPGSPTVHHPLGSRIAIAVGGAAVVTGAALGVLGVRKVPSSCSISSNQCTAPPGDPVFDRAKSGMEEVNLGIAIGSIGVAAVAGGFAWYFLKATPERDDGRKAVTPIVGRDAAGLALSGRF